MKNFSLAFLLFISITAFQCKTEQTTQIAGGTATIGWQDCAVFTDHDLTICFTGATEGRCPCWADCIWEGAITATLEVTAPDGVHTLVLSTNSNPDNLNYSDTLGSKIITFVQCNNFDFCDDYAKYKKYEIDITIENL